MGDDEALDQAAELGRVVINCPPSEGRTVRVTDDISWTLTRG